MNRQNDGRKSMPKLNCPYCGKRFADVPNAQFKNKSQLVTMDKISADDFILECPHCHLKQENGSKCYIKRTLYQKMTLIT